MNERVALGFGNNIDYEIAWRSDIVEALVRQYGIGVDELDIDTTIASERDLVVSILSFLKAGFGGERFVAAKGVIERFARRFETRVTLGGTSVRAALAMRKLGTTSALHLVTINDEVRRLLPRDCPYVCSNPEAGSHPHLIVQFEKGCRVRAGAIDLEVPQAERLIYHNDTDNIVMNLNRDFGRFLASARVLLISGFNAMQDETLLAERLDTVSTLLERLPQEAWVFAEDAGFYDPRFSELIFERLGGEIDIFSLNEDELQGHLGARLDLLDAAHVSEALADLAERLPVPLIVLHTKAWAAAYGDGAARFAGALRGGTTMATTRFCFGDDFTLQDYQRISRLPPDPAGAAFAAALNRERGEHVCCVPVARVDPSTETTVGLGDAFVGGFLHALLDR